MGGGEREKESGCNSLLIIEDEGTGKHRVIAIIIVLGIFLRP